MMTSMLHDPTADDPGPSPEAPSDRQLLDTLLRHTHDATTDRTACPACHAREAAFETLVRRHGPMVFGVCRRLLGNEHDAADAFQAVFLVLARKANAIRTPEVLGTWLYHVAYRTSMKARAVAYKRQAREK